MLVYKKITNRSAIKQTGLKEASHYYVLSDSLTLAAAELTGGLSHIIEQVSADTAASKPAVFNVYKIVSSTGYTTGNLVFLNKVGFSDGDKVVEYEEDWSEEDAQQISVTTTKTFSITDLE